MLINRKMKKYMKKGLLISNALSENVRPCSYELTISNKVLKPKKNNSSLSLYDASNMTNMYEETDIGEGYTLKSGEFIIAILDEDFNIPPKYSGVIIGNTSYNRLGVCIQTQLLNPGFKGKTNITIVNNSPNDYIITPNMSIAQIIFQKHKKIKKLDIYSENNKNLIQNSLQVPNIYSDYIGKVVRHFKGNYYYIENVCTDSETQETVIIYKNLYHRDDSNVWSRPAKMFFEEIDSKRKDNITKQKQRFQVVDDLAIDYTKKKK